jgi:transcriptional regulator of acetoin/glycerol metabolism
MAALTSYAWPGNIRELRNLVENLLLTGTGDIDRADLPADIAGVRTHDEPTDDLRLDNAARLAMLRAIQSADGNVSEAARKLGISRSTLHRRLRER